MATVRYAFRVRNLEAVVSAVKALRTADPMTSDERARLLGLYAEYLVRTVEIA